ncbi:hypothetical protein KKE45_01570 [Patescibacteria group bacterium]|nr:hypothetical protein [Patescibacteria group bacterium]
MKTKSTSNQTQSSLNEIIKSPNKSFQLSITVNKKTIQKEYQQVLSNIAGNMKIPGFRKGKVPTNLAEQKTDLSKVYEQIIQNVLPDKYLNAIKEHNLKPIIQPKILLENPPLSKNKDWQFQLSSCEKPEIILADYQKEIKKINKQASSSATKKTQSTSDKTQKHTQLILNLLSKKTTLELPEILIEAETKHKLSQLVNNLTQVDLTIDQYFKNSKSSMEEYKEGIRKNLLEKWKIDLALEKIAQKEKIKIGKKELSKAIASTPNGKEKESFIKYILTQQKTIKFLQTHNV